MLRKLKISPLQWKRSNVVKIRTMSTAVEEETSIREQMHYDCCIIGGGPAGLSAAIKLKQLSLENDVELSVCLIEKGSEVGAHILSGNVFETKALDELFPDWKTMDNPPPLETKAGEDKFLYLTNDQSSIAIPNILLPKQLHNDGNYIVSLSQLSRWLATQAEELGVEIYPGFSASEVIYNDDGNSIKGVATKDVGIAKDGSKKDTYTDGIELIARHTLFAEGCRGSCSEELINKFNLRENKDEQTYGLGIKEVWQIPEEDCKPGYIQHTLGWPLQDSPMSKTFGGTFLYHQAPNLILLGMVVGLDYENPYISPYREFQKWKHHPEIKKQIENGECISYGARVLNEGGYHAIPQLSFPGGSIIGCSAGFLNAVKIKGTHTAMKSGMIAASTLYSELINTEENLLCNREDLECNPDESPITNNDYENDLMNSWVAQELKEVRNTHAAFHWGLLPGMMHSALSCFITKGNEPWTLSNSIKDSDKTKPASEFTPIEYPKPDGKISFDLLSNLQKSGTIHDHDQPSHLKVKEEKSHVPNEISIKKYAGPEQRFCPAGVYEYNDNQELVINAQNCVHCKCCSIKTPEEYIKWTVPEGGEGPAYIVM